MKRTSSVRYDDVATRWMITSVSLVDWKIDPRRTSSRRKVVALEILPLCATAKPPEASSANSGCTFLSAVSPVVE